MKQPREQVMAAAMAAIADRGLAELTIAGLGREVGMSSGHILYYFGSKDELLLQTLEWSEEQLGVERRSALSKPVPARERIDAFVDLYLPDRPRDPRWVLWAEVWNRSQPGEDALRRQLELELVWHRDLVALVAEGISRGELRAVDPERFAVRARALLDGFGTHLVVGLPGTDRAEILGHVKEFLDDALL
ncbi:TetR/AcrR family transcriptional regulator [Streptomyces sp. ICBB 8177]|uniref:TetR/AcrR family transcriptional regulator n=1 Tax=Streptomyces sp. ICBB 8177 TaxID=563922 RepID=UPI000D6822FA|nr:TetR/AcrR family transcriptional regulator [Streptomyces sp. ICBB 8177]PWI44237.1 transcriptional regulator [Streptomyces sp. ICBB 8177]